MGRILSVDLGQKRTGFAWTDELQISINPLPTQMSIDFHKYFTSLLKTEQVSDVVFGLPTHVDGQLTDIGQKVIKHINAYSTKFEKITFHTIDEAFTSRRARQLMVHLGTKKKDREQKENIDKMSAVLILKDFIDKL